MHSKQNGHIVVSVCVTAYNHGKYIAQALDSILMQEVDFQYEIVVGEDCSTDNTREILLAYKEKYPDKIKLLLHDKNMGGKKNVITTLKNCSSKYIAMLDGDDYWIDSKKLQIQIALMEKNPDCYMSFHPAEARIDNAVNGNIIAKHANKNKIFTTSEVILGSGGFCPTASTVFRREAIIGLTELQLFHDAPVGDYFMQIFGSLNGGALYINKVMSVYRQGIDGSWSHSIKDIDKREKWSHSTLKSLNDLDIYLNGKYHNEIESRRSIHYYRMSIYYLINNMYDKFKTYIEASFTANKPDSLTYTIDYYLRSFPKILKYLRKLKCASFSEIRAIYE